MKQISKIIIILIVILLVYVFFIETEFGDIEKIRMMLIERGLPTPEHANITQLNKILKNHS